MFTGTFPLWLAAHLLLWTVPDYKNPTPAIIASVVTLAGCAVSFAYTLPSVSSALRLSRNDLSYGVYLYHAHRDDAHVVGVSQRGVAMANRLCGDIRRRRAILVHSRKACAHVEDDTEENLPISVSSGMKGNSLIPAHPDDRNQDHKAMVEAAGFTIKIAAGLFILAFVIMVAAFR